MNKIKEIFKNKKIENLVFFLIISVITLVIINNILKEDKKDIEEEDLDAELASSVVLENDLEQKISNILSKMEGIGKVSVLITYSESNEVLPMYDEKNSKSITKENDSSGEIRTVENEESEKSIITGSDSNPVVKKTINPKIEGAVIVAEGASNPNVEANIISAVEAITGLATHKIGVFEYKTTLGKD